MYYLRSQEAANSLLVPCKCKKKKGRNSTIHEAQAEKKKTRENSCAVFPENFQVHK
jgi:hypothetical protein